MTRFILFLTIWISTALSAAEPEVYTGVLAYSNSSRVMLTRLFVIPKVHSSIPDFHVNHYLGGFNSNEVIPTYYDNASLQSDGSYVLTDKRSQYEGPTLRVPTLFIKKTADGGFEGDYVSIEDGIAGKLTLIPGWSLSDDMLKEKQVSPAFEGSYMAACTGYSANHITELLELVPTRFEMKDMVQVPGADTTIKAINYLGALSCAPSMYPDATETNCGSFDRGNFDHYKNRLNLHISLNWQYICQVTPIGDMVCEGPRRQSCEFTRFKKDSELGLADLKGSPPNHHLPPIKATESTIPTSSSPCGELEGVTFGILRHATTGLYQRVKLEARAIEGQVGLQPGCQLVGSIRQHFNKIDDETIPPLTHVLSESWIAPFQGIGNIGASRVGGDAHLILNRVDGDWTGAWYSTLFGYVGEVVFTKDPRRLPDLEPNQYVPAIAGVFTQSPTHDIRIKRVVSISGYPDTSDTSSFDPIRQVRMSGILETTALDSNDDYGMSTINGIDTITYNYFSGQATFMSPSAYYFMQVGWEKLSTKIITRKWGGNYMPQSWTWDFIRGESTIKETK